MKYIVYTNERFLVAVEAENYGGAVRKVLHSLCGTWGVEVFSIADTKTSRFADILETAEMISLDELKAMMNGYVEACKVLSEAVTAVRRYTKEIEELERQMELARGNLQVAKQNYSCAVDAVAAQKKIINLTA